jgi:drug/metabolite transporter (DMT)-like permease
MLYGSILVISIGLFSGKNFSIDLNFSYLSSLMYLTVFGSIIAFTTYLNLLGKIGPDKSGYVSLVMPVIALGISTFLEGYQWTSYGIVGLLLILSGIFLALQRRDKSTREIENKMQDQP